VISGASFAHPKFRVSTGSYRLEREDKEIMEDMENGNDNSN
jgi:hypothetical protein